MEHTTEPQAHEEPLRPWALPTEEVIARLGSHALYGLTTQEAVHRLKRYGPNAIPEVKPEPLWKRYWAHLTGDAVVRLLLIGGLLSLLLQDYLEGAAIIIMLNIMAAFGLWQEGRAADAARSLRQADTPTKVVIRDGERRELPVPDIVPGDVVYLPTGSIAPADGRVIAAVNAEKDSSQLTGESLAVSIITHPLPADTLINEQHNMIYRGDAVVSGNLTMLVTATGPRTELGRIAARLSATDTVKTPLDEQLDNLGDAMTRIFIWIAIVVIGIGLFREFLVLMRGESAVTWLAAASILKEAFINAVALIIAAIPEGLPAVLSITLALATKVMAKRNALMRRPKAVEGSGSMTVLLTDKTGTITTNQMRVSSIVVNGEIFQADQLPPEIVRDPVLARLARIARLCNNHSNATEAALFRWVEEMGFGMIGGINESRLAEHEFNQVLKRMTTVYLAPPSPTMSDTDGAQEETCMVLTKGAPEPVLALCRSIYLHGETVPLRDELLASVQQAMTHLASQGLRVLALADRTDTKGHATDRALVESDLVFVGLIGIMDPPRDDVAPAVARLREAGIRTVMVTGDNPLTAYHIAKMVGITEELSYDEAVITGAELSAMDKPTPEFLQRLHQVRVFARVTPEHKAQIVHVMKEAGFIVGMTGDGVNDAIALKESDIGLAMGNGTDVAREASDVVLMDSRFGTIPDAVEEGRNVLYRIRLYLSYILSGNSCEVGAFVVAYALDLPIPLTALVLLVINFATDSFPALAMSFEPGEKDVMKQPPRRRDEPFITPVMWLHIGVQTVVATLVIMGVYAYYLTAVGVSVEVARAMAFMTYIFQKLYRAFTARSMTRNIWEIGVFRNRWSIGAVLVSFSIAIFFVYVPVVNTAMSMAPIDLELLAVLALVGLLPPIAEELTKVVMKGTLSVRKLGRVGHS